MGLLIMMMVIVKFLFRPTCEIKTMRRRRNTESDFSEKENDKVEKRKGKVKVAVDDPF